MSNVQLNNPISHSLYAEYDIPLGMDLEFMDLVQQIDRFAVRSIPETPKKIDAFLREVDKIIKTQLSIQNISKITGKSIQHLLDSEDVQQMVGVEVAKVTPPQRNIFIQDAKQLFKEHVESVFKETKKNLKHGSMLEKVGTVLSLPGRAITGINIFWDELVKKRPSLKLLNEVVVKPIMLGLYVKFLPEIAIIKACELVGRSMCAYAKAKNGEKWSAIKNAASEMLNSTVKDAERIAGTHIYSKISKTDLKARENRGMKQFTKLAYKESWSEQSKSDQAHGKAQMRGGSV